MPDPLHHYVIGERLTGLTVDRHHRIQLPGWDVVEFVIDDDPKQLPIEPTNPPPTSQDMGEWDLESLSIDDELETDKCR